MILRLIARIVRAWINITKRITDMRVIKPGIVKQQEWTAVCRNCGCVFAYNTADIRVMRRDSVVCPTCGRRIDVTDRDKTEQEAENQE